MSNIVDFIDLTTPVRNPRRRIVNTDIVINLDSDVSFDDTVTETSSSRNSHLPIQIIVGNTTNNLPKEKTNKKFGDCPICWEVLGKNPLASTICGHVFCIKCLRQSLLSQKQCPTCRHVLKGEKSFHPLYLHIV